MKLHLVRRACAASLFTLIAVAAAAPQADAQKPVDKSSPIIGLFDTEIISMDLSGSASLPLGPGGESVDVTVRATRATDHNSSRSNKTSHTPISGGSGGGPGDFAGKTLDLFSTLDLKFDLAIEDVDPLVDFDPNLGANLLQGSLSTSATLDAPAVPFLFDTDLPDFGMLAGRGVEHRGHVTVLKIAFGGGGGGGTIDIVANGLSVQFDQGGGQFTPRANGDVLHEASATMGVNAIYEGRAFSIPGLTGAISEVGRFSVAAIPEPSSLTLLLGGTLATLCGRRRS